MSNKRQTRRQKQMAALAAAEPDISVEKIQHQVKRKAPTNKERFQSLEDQIAGLVAAVGQLTATHDVPPILTAPASMPRNPDLARTPPHLSRASTPKSVPVRRALINKFREPTCNSSLMAEPVLDNVSLLHDDNVKHHVDNMARAAAARLPRSAGKTTYDVFLNKTVAYDMPRHYLSAHSQRRVRTLDSHDDLTLAEFLQGYIAMLSKPHVEGPVYKAMVQCLGLLGEALVDYHWDDMRDWINSILHEVGQGRISWLDEKIIADRLNTAKLQAARSGADEPVIPICANFTQGRCLHSASHGSFQHICVMCWATNGAQYPHSAQSCRRKNASQSHTPARNAYRDSPQQAHNNQQGGLGRPYYNNHGREKKNESSTQQHNDHHSANHSKN